MQRRSEVLLDRDTAVMKIRRAYFSQYPKNSEPQKDSISLPGLSAVHRNIRSAVPASSCTWAVWGDSGPFACSPAVLSSAWVLEKTVNSSQICSWMVARFLAQLCWVPFVLDLLPPPGRLGEEIQRVSKKKTAVDPGAVSLTRWERQLDRINGGPVPLPSLTSTLYFGEKKPT